MTMMTTDHDRWWEQAVVYCLDVETFADSDGDGIGDFPGLVDRLEHLRGLGVTCIWLMPFHPSPNRDDGYDVTDHYGVDPALGSPGDVAVFVRAAKHLGMRVIIDLVVNHTSDRHPWFRAARSSRSSRFRDYYVWRDEPGATPTSDVVFPDAEDSIWTLDERTGQYYLHHFYAHQPDLNIANPAVREEIVKIAGFWLQLGVDGFRVDAVPYLLETGGIDDAPEMDPHLLLAELRSFVSRRRGDAILLGEVNLRYGELERYFGDAAGGEIQLLFDFPLMQATHLALARCDARPIEEALERRPTIPAESQWAVFLRNHDELTLDQLDDDERAEVFSAFGPDPDMQLYGRGLRRRLPPMLGGDPARVRMAYSLLLTLPGTPVLFYGEEIGMGENLDVPGRLSVRTPMQWEASPSGGFSTARPSRFVRPLPEGRYGPLGAAVGPQRAEPDSLLRWMERMLRLRRDLPELGTGRAAVVTGTPSSVLVHRVDGASRSVLALHHLGADPVAVEVDLGEPMRVVDVVRHELVAEDTTRLELVAGCFDHRWLVLEPVGDGR